MHRLKFTEAPRFDIVVRLGAHTHRIAKLIFHRDGSVFVAVPTFPDVRGFVGIATIPAGGGKVDYNLRDFSLVTRELVKYSHHPDGTALFTQDGRVYSKIRRQSTPLDIMTGHLCSVIAAPTSGFPRPKGKDPQITFVDPVSESLEFRIARFRKDELGPFPPGDSTLVALTMSDGITYPGAFASPPPDFAFSDFFLFVSTAPRDTAAVPHCLMLLGGFDSMAVSQHHAISSEFLICMYPNTEIDALERTLGSIDLNRREQPPQLSAE